MATLQTLGVGSLSIVGLDGDYHRLNRIFRSKAEADQALAANQIDFAAGVINMVICGKDGLHIYDEATNTLEPADTPLRDYVNQKIADVIDQSPETLDTLNELAAAIGDDPAFFSTMASANAELEQDVDDINTTLGISENDQNIGTFTSPTLPDGTTLRAVLEAFATAYDARKTAVDNTIASLDTEVNQDVNDINLVLGVVENDQNLSTFTGTTISDDSSVKDALQDLETAHEAEVARVNAQIATDMWLFADQAAFPAAADNHGRVVHSHADAAMFYAHGGSWHQLETHSEDEIDEAALQAAIDAVQADVDQNESDADAADTALSNRLDTLEADPTTATALAAVQADVDQNETDSDSAIADEIARATSVEGALASDIATVQADVDANEADRKTYFKWESNLTKVVNPMRSSEIEVGNNIHIDPAAGYATQFDGNVEFDNNTTLSHGGTALTATFAELNYVDGVTSSIQTQLDTIQADVDQNETDADSAIATERDRIDAILASSDADKDSFAEIVALINSVDTANDDAFAGYVTSNDAAVAAVQADVDANEAAALAARNAIQADVDQNEADADAAIAAVQADVDQNEADADAADAALGVRIDAVETEIDTARTNIYTAIGQAEGATTMGTFTGSTLGDGQTVKQLLQTLETATEGEITARTAIAEFTSNLTKLKNDLRGTYINVGNNIELRASAGGRVEIVGDLYLDNNTAIDGAGTTLTSFANINAYDGRLNTLEADPTTATAVAAVQADVDQNEADADAAIALKADIAGPTFTGVPAAPTAAAGTNSTQVATTAFVSTAVANVIDSAPGALDTLNELAAALGDDANFSTTITNMVNANETHIDNAVTLTGVAKDAVNLGTFTGSTVSDSRTIKQALQELETKVEAVQTDVDGNESDADSAIAAVQADVDQNESDADAAIAAVQADVDQNESDADAAIALKLDASAVSTFGGTLVDDADAAAARTTLGLGSAATTDSGDYATAAQGATADAALAASAVSTFGGTLIDDADAAAARTTLGVDAAGTDNSTDVTLAVGRDYLTISGQEITLGAVDLAADVTGTLPVANGGTGATDISGIKAALDIDHIHTLIGVAANADDLGTFTGSVITDNRDVKDALQDLETEVETKADLDGVNIPGTYNNDADAATAGVAVGAIYKNTNGTIHWRVS